MSDESKTMTLRDVREMVRNDRASSPFDKQFLTLRDLFLHLDADELDMTVQVVPQIATTILKRVTECPALLQMDTWHEETICGTTHCLAGWAEVLSGLKLDETGISTGSIGRIVFYISTVNHEIPSFYNSNEDALRWLNEQAALEAT